MKKTFLDYVLCGFIQGSLGVLVNIDRPFWGTIHDNPNVHAHAAL